MPCPNIGKSNVLAVFAEIEDVSGTLQRPTASGYVLPTGAVNITQTPDYSNSEERSVSLNITAQFQNAVEAGSCSVPSYIRLPSNGGVPQGHALLEAMMGKVQAPDTVTCAIDGAITATDTTIAVDGVTGGILPMCGVIQIENEKIRYAHYVGGELTGCVRGYAGTTAATHDDDTTATLKSRVYSQDVCRSTVSVWCKLDHAVLFGSGATVTQTEIPLSKTGGQAINFTLQFRKLGWCGRSVVSGVTGAVITVKTAADAYAANGYSIGGIIKNTTKADDNSGAGYTIVDVDNEHGTITVSPTPAGWEADDQLDAWLPTATPIGEPIESRNTSILVNGVKGKMLEGTVTIGTPTEFASEVGDMYPGENADTMRDISMNTSIMFRPDDIIELGRGYQGYELPVTVVMGAKANATLSLIMPRVKFNMPSVQESGAFLTLERSGAILGTNGEDSLYLVQE